jgi:3-oxoacid CoA-transferase subunit B
VNLIVTELAVIEITPQGLVLRELAPGVSPEVVQKATEPSLRLGSELKVMASEPLRRPR